MIQYIRKTLFWTVVGPLIILALPVLFLVWVASAYDDDDEGGW